MKKQICLVTVLLGLSACGMQEDSSEAYKGESAEHIFEAGEYAVKHGDYIEATKRFEAIDTQYPFVKYAEMAKLHLVYAYYKNDEHASAIAAATRYIRLYPTSENVDYAYYLRALSNYGENIGVFERIFSADFSKRDLDPLLQAYADFTQVYQHYPNSQYANESYRYAVYLRDLLAQHELDVGKFYYDRKAYIAAANRANVIVRHYQGAPVMPDALILMIKSYRAMHLTELEADAMKVLKYNYPKRMDAF